jgi:DNA repair exonuclease SbcCD ATPase subunit
MNNLSQKFDQIKNLYHRKLGQLESLRNRLNSTNEKVLQLTTKEDQTAKASLFLQSLSDSTRIHVLDRISGIVTECLQVVKDPNLEFKMVLQVKANQPVLEMYVRDRVTDQLYDAVQSMGGGLCDLISLSLRVALLVKWSPSLSRILVLDEIGKHISIKDQELLAEFVQKLSTALNVQFVWISHSEVLEKSASKVFQIIKENGVSHVSEKTILE